MRKGRPSHDIREIVRRRVRCRFSRSGMISLYAGIPLKTTLIFRSNLSRFVMEVDLPVMREWCCVWGCRNMGVYKVQSNATLTQSVRLLAVLTSRKRLVAFEMSFSARQASRPDTLWFLRICLAGGTRCPQRSVHRARTRAVSTIGILQFFLLRLGIEISSCFRSYLVSVTIYRIIPHSRSGSRRSQVQRNIEFGLRKEVSPNC